MADGQRTPRYDAAEACRALAAADPKLGALIERAGPYTLMLKSQHSPFDALLEAIVSQQLHGKAAMAILHKLLKLFGEIHPTPELLLLQPDDAMRAAGLSKNKMLALQDLARKTLDGTVPSLAAIRRLSDDEIVTRLCAVRGIGAWTVQMMLMFRLGRPDVLPLTDYGVRKGFALTFSRLPKSKPFDASMLADMKVMARRGERWRPWRSVAAWYMWRACDLAGKPFVPPPVA
ncbi:DNA-3-methyladenine glycosylase [Acidipila sp. EB88]|uniref:DNA-3-methyladenine glycosylase family protein n=1 Tax=Acidipila sp. EB88 TaxID=2305226 RepID=UPI000F5E2F0D|nr:DNA-3-methyladenine glycosylase [Acidipila sp. EB88]RRA48303.1 DNA-3-methyladenine glycosylase 2 family protein [Acidipila sp. EB88]